MNYLNKNSLLPGLNHKGFFVLGGFWFVFLFVWFFVFLVLLVGFFGFWGFFGLFVFCFFFCLEPLWLNLLHHWKICPLSYFVYFVYIPAWHTAVCVTALTLQCSHGSGHQLRHVPLVLMLTSAMWWPRGSQWQCSSVPSHSCCSAKLSSRPLLGAWTLLGSSFALCLAVLSPVGFITWRCWNCDVLQVLLAQHGPLWQAEWQCWCRLQGISTIAALQYCLNWSIVHLAKKSICNYSLLEGARGAKTLMAVR